MKLPRECFRKSYVEEVFCRLLSSWLVWGKDVTEFTARIPAAIGYEVLRKLQEGENETFGEGMASR